MRYLLNSAVLTSAGSFDYRHITAEEAKLWIQSGDWISTIGYEDTANALSLIMGVHIPKNRVTIRMEMGDEALVFRLVLPPGARRTEPLKKGKLGVRYILEHCEIGLLRRSK